MIIDEFADFSLGLMKQKENGNHNQLRASLCWMKMWLLLIVGILAGEPILMQCWFLKCSGSRLVAVVRCSSCDSDCLSQLCSSLRQSIRVRSVSLPKLVCISLILSCLLSAFSILSEGTG